VKYDLGPVSLDASIFLTFSSIIPRYLLEA
jgi:hypothetical protein